MSEIDLSQLPDFIVEATEHLEEMETLLLQLVESPDDLEILNEIFRPVHTIKGSAQFIGVARASMLAHRLEDLMDKLRDGSMQSTPAIVETLIETRDRIVQLVKELEQSQEEESSVDDL
ncbi:MAG: Hpt domain-containing protein, partial [Gammaproteobacteria bacterium]|nr:Hpt domain-containing protein [Gammaproteobacteria bacterium]